MKIPAETAKNWDDAEIAILHAQAKEKLEAAIWVIRETRKWFSVNVGPITAKAALEVLQAALNQEQDTNPNEEGR